MDNLSENPSIFSQRALQPLPLMGSLMGVSKAAIAYFGVNVCDEQSDRRWRRDRPQQTDARRDSVRSYD